MKANPLTDEYSSFGSFDQLAENNRTQIKGLIEDLAKQQTQPGSIAQKIGNLYNIAMDSAKLNADGVAPIKGYLVNWLHLKTGQFYLRRLPQCTGTASGLSSGYTWVLTI